MSGFASLERWFSAHGWKPAQTMADRYAEIDYCWTATQTKFGATVVNGRAYIGYYDGNRQLTIVQFPLDRMVPMLVHKLDSWIGSDSHANIAIAVDRSGALHVAANMHVSPLNYFRSSGSGDVRTLTKVSHMCDKESERRTTYPSFLADHAGELIFGYRSGSSGNAIDVYLKYDTHNKSWDPLHAGALIDGQQSRSAYAVGPRLGADGRFHMVWVWRDNPNADSNHSLCYARSLDLLQWEKADGTAYKLPITFDQSDVIDPVPVKGGMINNNTAIGHDASGNVTVTYHKYTSDGSTQIFLARLVEARWDIVQISRWKNYRWDFGGTGSIDFEIEVEGAYTSHRGDLVVPVTRRQVRTEIVVDSTLKQALERRSTKFDWLPEELRKPSREMVLNVVTSSWSDQHMYLIWQSAKPGRDRLKKMYAPSILHYFMDPSRRLL